jgi:hypothetical protein
MALVEALSMEGQPWSDTSSMDGHGELTGEEGKGKRGARGAATGCGGGGRGAIGGATHEGARPGWFGGSSVRANWCLANIEEKGKREKREGRKRAKEKGIF